MSNEPLYLPGLNGIRAIAAVGVVVSHITRRGLDFGLNPYLFGSFNKETVGWDLAEFGVTMFFTLSGFLITYLLLHEKEKGPVNILKFYARRILRIWPLYYVYIALCVLLWFIFKLNPDYSFFSCYIFFAANVPFILSASMPFLVHFWSLGVEEQFYLFWPWFSKFSIPNLLKITFIIITIILGLKLALHLFSPGGLLEKIIHVTRFHCMLMGCLTAILYYRHHTLFLKISQNKAIQALAWIGVLLIVVNRFHFISFMDHEFAAVITATIIVGQISRKGLISLENNLLDTLGKLSYGIYVLHPILIFLFSKILKDVTTNNILNYLIVYCTILLSTILLAAFSYNYLEKPFLRLKSSKYTVLKTYNSKQIT